jgi:hypothetical protein
VEQLSDIAAGPALERESDAAVLVTMVAIAAQVDSPAPNASEVKEDVAGVERDAAGDPRVVEPGPEILSGELILPPPPASTILPVAV